MPFKGQQYDVRRRHPRRVYCNVIRFSLNSSSPKEIFTGLSINISDSGMCLYSADRLREGEELMLHDNLPVKYQKARVVWVKRYLAGLHKAGMEFFH